MRLHAIVDNANDAATAVAAGATVVQLRLKDVDTGTRVEMGRVLRHLPAMLVINDDVEAALGCGADGVHLGQEDPGLGAALAGGLLVGFSAATVGQARVGWELGAAYIGAGPVWETPTKPDAGPAIGLDGLAAIAAAVEIPVVAIGGIDAGNAGLCVRAGAAGVAVVRAARAAAAVRAAVDEALGQTAAR